jgi:hypothetical protein
MVCRPRRDYEKEMRMLAILLETPSISSQIHLLSSLLGVNKV